MENEMKEICDSIVDDVEGDNKFNLFAGSVYYAELDGYLSKKQRDTLYRDLEKIADVCNIKIGRDALGIPIIKR